MYTLQHIANSCTSVGRYFVIVHPIRAREMFGMTFAKWILASIVIFSAIANMPRFWFQVIRKIECFDGSKGYYISKNGSLKEYETIYLTAYFIIAICVPFVVLVYCNIYLVQALRHHRENPVQHRRSSEQASNSSRLTLCLVIIILALLVLVIPGEVIHFLKGVVLTPKQLNPDSYNLPLAITNCMQAFNFSFNFILYCIITKSFRHTLSLIIRCHCEANQAIKRNSFSCSTRFSLVNPASPTKTEFPLHNLISNHRETDIMI